MGVRSEKVEDVVILKLSGNFFGDKETDELRDVFRRLVSEGNLKLIISLGGVGKINSMALSVLVHIHTNYVNRGGRVILADLGDSMQLLAITKLLQAFEIGPSLSEAMAKFGI